jgi:anti-sigma regulatory factor (Ser/Thr protein kinase)
MEQELWSRRSLPPRPETVLVAWERALCAPTDLTVSRRELQQTVGAARLRDGAPVDVGALLLVYEELTSNAVRHGRSPVRVRVVVTGRGWLVDVTDAAAERPPLPAVDRDPADGGMGLYLVARLCGAHGWTVDEGRKHVWACVEAA